MSKNAQSWMHADSNECNKVFPHFSHLLHLNFWQEIYTIKVINSTSQRGKQNYPKPNQQKKKKTNHYASPRVNKGHLPLDLVGRVTFIKIEYASNYKNLWTYVGVPVSKYLITQIFFFSLLLENNKSLCQKETCFAYFLWIFYPD